MSAEGRLAHPDNLCNRLVEFKPLNPGNKSVGDVSLPPALRTLIASVAVSDGNKVAAKAFDVAPNTVSTIKKKETEAGRVESKVDKIRDKALDSLASLFDSVITENKLSGLKTREGISAAKDLASVVERIAPKTSGGNNVQFVVFSPRIRSEEEYEAIDITARSS